MVCGKPCADLVCSAYSYSMVDILWCGLVPRPSVQCTQCPPARRPSQWDASDTSWAGSHRQTHNYWQPRRRVLRFIKLLYLAIIQWPMSKWPIEKNSLISQQVQTSHSVQMLWLKVTLLCCVLGSCTCRQVCFSWRMNMDSGRLMLMWLTLNVNWSQKLTLTLIVGLLRPGKNLTDYGIVFTNIGI